MSFRYIITRPVDGHVKGTNDQAQAESAAQNDACFVVDTHTSETLQPDGGRQAVEELS